MCLETVYRGKQRREALAKLPDEFPVWKILRRISAGYEPAGFRYTPSGRLIRCLAGQHKSPGTCRIVAESRARYDSGWHANINRDGAIHFKARNWSGCGDMPNLVLVKCTARKRHITSIGEQWGAIVVVLSHITFPPECAKPKKGGK